MNKKLRLFSGLTLLNLIFSLSLLAQIATPPVNIQSPNVAGLGLYGEYPVSYFTGVPDISIPLYTLKEREISVPISMSYHASGFRPEQHPGWVGANWSLNAGGVITRVVNDLPDEQSIPNQPGVCSLAGYIWNGERTLMQDTLSWNSNNTLFDVANDDCNESQTSPMQLDSQPDQFNFNFDGYSGSFFLGPDGNWKIKCDKHVVITPLNSLTFLAVPFIPPSGSGLVTWGYSKSITGFTITADNGTQYVFGGDTTSIEYSEDYFNQNTAQWTANSWYLTKIISKNNNETVTFQYQPDSFINQLYTNLTYNGTTNTTNNNFTAPVVGGPFTPCSSSGIGPVAFGGQLIRPTYLTTITTPNYTVTFKRCNTTELFVPQNVYDNGFSKTSFTYGSNNSLLHLPFMQNGNQNTGGSCVVAFNSYYSLVEQGTDGSDDYNRGLWNGLFWKQLNNISITGSNNGVAINDGLPIKQFTFSYSDTTAQRLTLNSITETGSDQVAKPPYQFSYYQAQNLPPYFNFSTPTLSYVVGGTDHYGFWNNSSYTFVFSNNPATVDTTGYFNSRLPQGNYAEATMLQEVIYPTGGKTDFYYEPNDYGKAVGVDRTTYSTYHTNYQTGGIRIRSIVSYDPNNSVTPLVKDYYYVTNYDKNYTPGNPSYLSSGVLGGMAQYSYQNLFIGSGTQANGLVYAANLFSAQSVLPVSNNSMGSHIGYSEVVEKRSDGSYTKYYYTNFDNGHADEKPSNTLTPIQTYYQPFTSLEEERGKLQKEELHDNTGTRVKTTAYQYVALDKLHQFAPSIKAYSYRLCPDGASTAFGYAGSAYQYYTYSYLPSTQTDSVFDRNGLNPFVTVQNFYYDNFLNHRMVTRSTLLDSKGETITKVNIYPLDYASTAGFINQMVAINNVGTPIETVTLKSSPSLPNELISGKITEYLPTGDYPLNIYSLDLAQPIANTAFKLSNQALGAAPFVGTNTAYSKDTHYRAEATMDYNFEKITDFKAYVNPTTANFSTAYLWDVSRRNPIAAVKNANFMQIAFTGFEENETYNATRTNNPNNWNIPSGVMNNTMARTGHNCGYITGSTITTVSAMSIGTYIVSYWAQGGAVTLSGGTAGSTITGETIGGWTYYQTPITLSALSNISVAGNAANQYIDDLRLYPQASLMTTYTYDPLIGMTSSTDPKGEVTFYEYDGLQRLINIKDKDGHITKHMLYHYQGQ